MPSHAVDILKSAETDDFATFFSWIKLKQFSDLTDQECLNVATTFVQAEQISCLLNEFQRVRLPGVVHSKSRETTKTNKFDQSLIQEVCHALQQGRDVSIHAKIGVYFAQIKDSPTLPGSSDEIQKYKELSENIKILSEITYLAARKLFENYQTIKAVRLLESQQPLMLASPVVLLNKIATDNGDLLLMIESALGSMMVDDASPASRSTSVKGKAKSTTLLPDDYYGWHSSVANIGDYKIFYRGGLYFITQEKDAFAINNENTHVLLSRIPRHVSAQFHKALPTIIIDLIFKALKITRINRFFFREKPINYESLQSKSLVDLLFRLP